MPGFGTLAAGGDFTKVKNGTYPATIISAKVVMENGVPKLHPESHKASVDVSFQLDIETDDGAVELKRRMGITYGKNRTTGQFSNWAQMLAAFAHVACGDDAQKHLGEAELIGCRGMVRVKNVESNGNKYSNVVDFEEIDEVPVPQAAANRTRLEAAVKSPEPRVPANEPVRFPESRRVANAETVAGYEAMLDEIPF